MGRIASIIVFALGLIYFACFLAGFLALSSPAQPIADPYFTLMELLIIFIAPCMVIGMAGVYRFASTHYKTHSLSALGFMIVMAGITTCVHAMVLLMNHAPKLNADSNMASLLSFRWPSLAYILDIIAWDWFYALAMLCAAPVFNKGRQEKVIRACMYASGLLSLIGLAGVPMGNMQVRNIGITGYAIVGPIVFLLIGLLPRKHRVSNRAPGAIHEYH